MKTVNENKEKIIIPIIKNYKGYSALDDIVAVQPMKEPHEGEWSLNVLDKEPEHKFGETIHSFLYGYQAYDGNDFIYIDEFIDKYGKDKLLPKLELK